MDQDLSDYFQKTFGISWEPECEFRHCGLEGHQEKYLQSFHSSKYNSFGDH